MTHPHPWRILSIHSSQACIFVSVFVAVFFKPPSQNQAPTNDVSVQHTQVGMGLNLNIRRVVFHSLNKPGRGFTYSPLSVSAVKQIAGRAGRRSRCVQNELLNTESVQGLHTV